MRISRGTIELAAVRNGVIMRHPRSPKCTPYTVPLDDDAGHWRHWPEILVQLRVPVLVGRPRMPSHLWALSLVLLISISPNSCGACTNEHHHVLAITLTLTVPDMNLDLHTITLFPCLELRVSKSMLHNLPPRLQHSHRNIKNNSNAPLTHASSCPYKVIAPTVRMDQSGNGTYQGSPT